MAQNLLIYVPEPHCLLCQNGLPRDPALSSTTNTPMSWERKLIGLVDIALNPSQGSIITVVHATLHEDGPSVEPTFTIKDEGVNKTILVAYDRPGTNYRPIFFVHEFCYKIVESQQGTVCSCKLYGLAAHTSQIMPRECWPEEPSTSLASFTGTIQSGMVDTANTSSGSCILKCTELPFELQSHVLKDLREDNDNTAFSLMTALQTSAIDLLRSELEVQNHPNFRKLMPADHVEVAHVSASLVTIFGSSYITAVEVFHNQDHRDAPGQQCIEVKIDSVRQIEFIVGMHGITAIRFHFDDKSVSRWLGDARKGWRCKPINVTRSDLCFPRHGQHGIVRRFSELLARAPADAPLNVLWDVSSRPVQDGVSFITRYYTELYRIQRSPIPGLPMCKYLPLYFDGKHATAITVHMFDLGTSCIVVHGNTTRHEVSVPDRRGVSSTFYFKDGEQIVTLGLVTTGHPGHRCGPFLLLQTNLDRIKFFGPQGMLQEKTADWMSLIPDHLDKKCVVMGIIVDRVAVSLDCFKTFGVRCMPTEGVATGHKAPASSLGQRFVLPTSPTILKRTIFKTLGMVTSARLYDIKQLRVLEKTAISLDMTPMCRVSGLWILHGDGSVETIGCWDDSLTKNARVIYDVSQGRLNRAIFRLKDGRNKYNHDETVPIVFKIDVETVPHESTEEDRAEEPSKYYEVGSFIFLCKCTCMRNIIWTFTDVADNLQHAPDGTTKYNILPQKQCDLLRIEH